LHNGYKAGAIGAGAYDGSPSVRTIYVSPEGSRGGSGMSAPGGPRFGGAASPAKANFVHTYANHISHGNPSGSGLNHGGSRGGSVAQNHVSQNPAYWRDRSYFFGYSSPFGFYLGYPWWWPGYGNRFGYFPWFAYGVGGGYGYGYGYPYLAYQSVYPYYGYNNPASTVAAQNGPPNDQLENSLDYASQGEIAFREGKYPQAVQDWRHALVDDPQNGAIVLLLSQALFATGQHVEAAGALQAALQMLPEDKWGTVVTHYKELYPNIQAYTDQLRAAEKLRSANPEIPALHLLLGYHFGYLGYPKEAVKELKKSVELSPKDEIARKLYETFSAKLGPTPKPSEEVPETPEETKPEATKAADEKS
jgi:hypothetical protein